MEHDIDGRSTFPGKSAMNTGTHRLFNAARITIVAALITCMAVATGCDRSPEDLEDFRDTQGGQQQIAQWVQDEGEPMEVRKRGMQILVEDGQFHKLADVLDGIEDDDQRAEITSAALPVAEQMWEEQDFPEITDELLEQGGSITPDGLNAIHAVNALYHLTPHMDEDARETAQQILRDWISDDQVVRTQWAQYRIPLIVPVAGVGAMEEVTNWILEASDVHSIVSSLRNHAPESEYYTLDKAVAERAKEEHPDVSEEVIAAIRDAESDGIVPYLEVAVTDEQSSGTLFQVSIDTLFDVAPEEARDIGLKVVEETSGTFRWVAIQNLVDTHGLAIVPDIADALPEDAELYDDDELRERPHRNCIRIAEAIADGDYDDDPELVSQLLASDHWPAQVFGLRCAQELEHVAFRDTVSELRENSTAIAGHRDGQTIGELAGEVIEAFDEADD